MEPGRPGFESQLCGSLAVCPWEGHFASLCLGFFIGTVGIRTRPAKAMVRMNWDNVGQVPSSGPALCWALNPRVLPLQLHARFSWQVDEIYHDESLGAHINIALVRLIMVGYRQVTPLRQQAAFGGGRGVGLMHRTGCGVGRPWSASGKHFVSRIRTLRPLEPRLQGKRHVGMLPQGLGGALQPRKRTVLQPGSWRALSLRNRCGDGLRAGAVTKTSPALVGHWGPGLCNLRPVSYFPPNGGGHRTFLQGLL